MQLLIPRYNMTQLYKYILKPIPPKQMNQKKKALQIAIKDKYQELEQSGLLDENLQQEQYTHKTNYNFETYLKYTKLVQAQKLPQNIQKQKRISIYDKPKFDISLNDYYVWPSFHNPYYKPSENSEVVVCKIFVSPKQILHTFGIGTQPWRNTIATREYDFEDSNLDRFCLYDAKQTTQYWGPNRSEQFYLKQQYLRPIYRKKPWPTYDEFWQSEEKVPFRVNCTRYGDFRRFKAWVLSEIEKYSNQPSYEERIIQKYGKPDYFDDYNTQHVCKSGPSVYKYQREYFQEKGQKLDPTNILNQSIQPPEHLGEEYRVQNK